MLRYDYACWSIMVGTIPEWETVKSLKSRSRYLQRNGRSPEEQLIINTALASLPGQPLSTTYLFRYTMELIDSFHNMQGKGIVASMLDSDPPIKRATRRILRLIQGYRGNDPTSYLNWPIFKLLIQENKTTIMDLSGKRMRVLSLGEMCEKKFQIPDGIESKMMFRCVNAGARRILNTKPVKSPVGITLNSALNTHVNGSSERTHVPDSNKSLAISLTSSIERAMQYGAFYMQVIPLGLIIQATPRSCIETNKILKSNKQASKLAINISTAHQEYVPVQISHIAERNIHSITPLLLRGTVITTGQAFSSKVREFWYSGKPFSVRSLIQGSKSFQRLLRKRKRESAPRVRKSRPRTK